MKFQVNKIVLGWLAFIFIVFHVGAVFNSALPAPYRSEKIRNATSFYVTPIFTQSWALFAPCPVIDAKMDVQFFFENDSTEWIRPSDDYGYWHSILRGSHHGELIVGESNIVYWLMVDLSDLNLTIEDEIPTGLIDSYLKGHSYYKIRNYVSGLSRYLFDKKPKGARVKFDLTNVNTGEHGILQLPKIDYK